MQGVLLRDWLEMRNDDGSQRSIRALAARAQVTRHVIYRLLDGHVPRVETAKRVERATGGEVTAAELLGVEAA